MLLFDEENIFFIDDLCQSSPIVSHYLLTIVIDAEDRPLNGKVPAEKVMTDGCGLINAAALKLIATLLKLSTRSTAIQGRLLGAKGIWIVHPSDDSSEPKIWIRSSQAKIVHNYPLDRAHRIFDLLSVSQPSKSTSLSRQSIENLAHNGVPHDVLVSLLVDGLTDEVEPLMKWDGPHAMISLAHLIGRFGNVPGTRLLRAVAGLGRALGLTGREWRQDDVGVTDQDAARIEALEDEGKPMYTGRSEYSGCEFNSPILADLLIIPCSTLGLTRKRM